LDDHFAAEPLPPIVHSPRGGVTIEIEPLFANFKLLTFPSLRLVAKVPFAAAPAACSWSTSDPTLDV
jgi:hypothetical protein